MRRFLTLCFIPLILLVLLVGGVLFALLFRLPLTDLWQAINSRETLFALRLSLFSSITAAILALALGVPSGYLLARKRFFGKTLVDSLLDIPLVMPPLVAGVGLLLLLGQTFWGRHLAAWGIRVVFSPMGAVVAQTFIAAPIVIRSSKAAFEAVSPRFEQAAQTLGLRPFQLFLRITLPLARQGILSGTVLAWARAMGEFGATLMVAGATRMRTETLPIAVYLNISSGELGTALACAWMLMGSGFILLVILKWIGGSNRSDLTGF